MANDTPRVAVIGCGYWGKNLVRNLAEIDALAAVCDADAETAGRLGEQYHVPSLDLQTVLDSTDIHGVVIAGPAEVHAQLAAAALDAGKNVFVEKPLALDVAEATRLWHRAVQAQLILMVGHLMQYHPAFVRLKEMVQAGELGRLRHISSQRLNLGRVRREENILWSFAPHDISMILSLTGTEPETVSAIGSNYLHSKIADVTTTHLSFPGGENAQVFVSWFHPVKEQNLVVVCDEGMAVFNDREPWERKLTVYPHKIHWIKGAPVPERAEGAPIPIEVGEPLKLEMSHFLDCINGMSQCRTDGQEGIRVLKVLQASERAMEEGRSVSIDSAVGQPADFFAHASAFIDEGCVIGEGTRIWHCSHILPGVEIGNDCVIGQNVMIGPDVKVGNRCKIQNNVSLYKGVTLEDGVFCGPSSVFTNVMTPRAEVERKDSYAPTLVRRGSTIGANATIVCGTELGMYSFIAAGAVVTRDVPPFALMAGVPARRIGWVSHSGEVLGEDLVCPRTGRRYLVNSQDQLEECGGNDVSYG